MAKKQAQIINEPSAQVSPIPEKKNYGWLVVATLAFLLYANTIPFQFALDDKLAISENEFTKKGIAGIPDLLSHDMFVGFFGKQKNLVEGGRYRPLSMVMFALEWEFFGPIDTPASDKIAYQEKMNTAAMVGHLLNAVFYALTGVILFAVLSLLFPVSDHQKWYFTIPFVATILYITHPIHTEVVANVKSRDEILATLGGFLCLLFTLRYLKSGSILLLIAILLTFFLAMCSKESAITFCGVIPLTVLFFRKVEWKKGLITTIPLVIAVAGYLAVRSVALGDMIKGEIARELMNDPFLLASTGEKLATIALTLGLYLKLLLFPISLTHDYYPWYPLASESFRWGDSFPYSQWTDPGVLISLLLYLVLAAFGVFQLIRHVKYNSGNIYGYVVLLYLGTFILFSNLFFSIGTFMNERFMYLPSLGLAIAGGIFLTRGISRWIQSEKIRLGLFLIIACLYSAKTISRNKAWENDFTLATTDVLTSTTSAKVLMSAGGSYLDKAKETANPVEKTEYLNKSYTMLRRSIELYPTYIQPMILIGLTSFEMKDYEQSVMYFENCLKIDKNYKYAINNMAFMGDTLVGLKNFDLAIKALNILITHQPANVRAYATLGEIYGKHLGRLDESMQYLEKAYSLDPENTGVLQKIGVVHAIKGRTKEALEFFSKVVAKEPENAHVLMNMGLIYMNTGNAATGTQYLEKAYSLNPSLRPR